MDWLQRVLLWEIIQLQTMITLKAVTIPFDEVFFTLARNPTPRSYAQRKTVKQWFLKNEYNRGVQKYTKLNLAI